MEAKLNDIMATVSMQESMDRQARGEVNIQMLSLITKVPASPMRWRLAKKIIQHPHRYSYRMRMRSYFAIQRRHNTYRRVWWAGLTDAEQGNWHWKRMAKMSSRVMLPFIGFTNTAG